MDCNCARPRKSGAEVHQDCSPGPCYRPQEGEVKASSGHVSCGALLPATLAAPAPSLLSSVRNSSFRRKKPSHHTRRPPPSRPISMFSSLKSLITTPLSWFVNTGDSFKTNDTTSKCKLIHNPAHLYNNEGDKQDAPLAYRVKHICLNSPERVNTLPTAPTPYLDPPTPSL